MNDRQGPTGRRGVGLGFILFYCTLNIFEWVHSADCHGRERAFLPFLSTVCSSLFVLLFKSPWPTTSRLAFKLSYDICHFKMSPRAKCD